jgi:hypothetical protein
MDEELTMKEKILSKEEEVLDKALDELLEKEELCNDERAVKFMEAYARFKDATTKAREIDLAERKENNAIFGSKLKTKLGIVEMAIKTGLIALALWFELKKGAIFGGFMLKKVIGTLFTKSSFTS